MNKRPLSPVTPPPSESSHLTSSNSSCSSSSSSEESATRLSSSDSESGRLAGRRAAQKQSELVPEVIHSAFMHEEKPYFIMRNNDVQGETYDYVLKPLEYVAGTIALKQWYEQTAQKRKSKASIVIAPEHLKGDNHHANRMNKLLKNFYIGTMEYPANGPKSYCVQHDKKAEKHPFAPVKYRLNIPEDWGQLARYRLEKCRINKVLGIAVISTSKPASRTSEKSKDAMLVYIIRWQNENCCEICPAEWLRMHHEDQHAFRVLDYIENATFIDIRSFRSAASFDFYKSGLRDGDPEDAKDLQYTNTVIHEFNAPLGAQKRNSARIGVYTFLGWPISVAEISEYQPTDGRKSDSEDEESEVNALAVVVHDKFTGTLKELNSALKLNELNPKPFTLSLPAKWRDDAEKFAADNKSVIIINVLQHHAHALAYMVQWPSVQHPTLVPLLTLRKQHSRQMLKFYEQQLVLPRLKLEQITTA